MGKAIEPKAKGKPVVGKRGARKGGRPRFYQSPEEFSDAVDAYIVECVARDENPTLTGMALALGFGDRQSFYEYEKRPEFHFVARRARTLVENVYERRLLGNNQAAGAIFALKNLGWTDQQTVRHEGGLSVDFPDLRRKLEDRIEGIRSRLGPIALPAPSGNGDESG